MRGVDGTRGDDNDNLARLSLARIGWLGLPLAGRAVGRSGGRAVSRAVSRAVVCDYTSCAPLAWSRSHRMVCSRHAVAACLRASQLPRGGGVVVVAIMVVVSQCWWQCVATHTIKTNIP